MTADERSIIFALSRCKFYPGSFAKRFTRQLNDTKPEKELTEFQKEWMLRLVYTFRKQIPETYEKYKHLPHCAKKEKATHPIPEAIPEPIKIEPSPAIVIQPAPDLFSGLEADS